MMQLEKAYGREISRAIFGGCGTKAIFNPQESESARAFSDYLGDEHLEYKTKSRSTGGGKSNTSTSQQEKTRKLCAPEEFLRFPTGTCVLINPGYSTKKETSIPLHLMVKIPKADVQRMDTSQKHWEQVKAKLIKRSSQIKVTDEEMQARKEYFYEHYPVPTKPDPNAEKTAKWSTANGFL